MRVRDYVSRVTGDWRRALGFEPNADVTADEIAARHRRLMAGRFLEIDDIVILNLALDAARNELAARGSTTPGGPKRFGATARSAGLEIGSYV